MRVVEGETIRRTLPYTQDVRFVRCTFDSAGLSDTDMSNADFVDCAAWSLSFRNVVFRDCKFENLKSRLPGQRGGRTMPVFFWGCFARHLTIRGTVGGFMWNPPRTRPVVRREGGVPEIVEGARVDLGARTLGEARRFYETVDWALDISGARFRSVPTFAFGPPGDLVRRDPTTQPLVSRQIAAQVDWRALRDRIGIWWVGLAAFGAEPWPDTKVLVPALGGRKTKVEQELAGIAYLREAGLTIG